MPTIKQKRVAKKIVEAMNSDEPITAGEILESSGYKHGSIVNPKLILEGQGVKQALAEMGFTIETADSVVSEILLTGQEHNRLKAAEQVYKRLGAYAAEKSVNLNINADLKEDPEAKALTEEYETKLLERIKQGD